MYANHLQTGVDSLEAFPEMQRALGSTTMRQASGIGELSGHAKAYGNTELLLCKFFLTLIQNEEKLIKAKADFMELRFDCE